MEKSRELTYEAIAVGDVFKFEVLVDPARIKIFAELSGDFNPLHMDSNYAAHTEFKKPIAHGMLLASFFSKLIGVYCPGKKALYISQDIRFRAPVFIGEVVIVEGRIVKKVDFGSIVELETKIIIKSTGQTAIDGLARAKFLN